MTQRLLVQTGDVVVPGSRLVEPRDPEDLDPTGAERHESFLPGRGAGGEGENIVSKTYGTADVKGRRIGVVPLLQSSKDKMQVRGDIYPKTYDDVQIEAKHTIASINADGFRGKTLKDVIDKAIARAQETGQHVRDVCVVRGHFPKAGTDARFEVHVPDGSPVAKGEIIASLTPASEGEPGIDVFGKRLPPRRGREVLPKVGANIQPAPTSSDYISTAYGVVSLDFEGIPAVNVPVDMTPDELGVTCDIYPTTYAGSRIELDDILDLLQARDVRFGIAEDRIRSALKEARASGTVYRRVVVAEGRRPKNEVPERTEFLFRIDGKDPFKFLELNPDWASADDAARELFLKEKPLGRKIPGQAAEDGVSVYGKRIPANRAERMVLEPGDNVIIARDGRTFVADNNGYPEIRGGKIHILPAIETADDEMSATLTIYPPQADSAELVPQNFLNLLNMEGVVYGVDGRIVMQMLEGLRTTGKPQTKTVVARGLSPQHGRNATVNFHVRMQESVGLVRPDGSIDYRERETIPNVQRGQLILTKVPATEGKGGKTVTGRTVDPVPGKDRDIKALQNVRAHGLRYYAEISGVLQWGEDNWSLSVEELHHIAGDVDYNTGNVTVECAVLIGGSIKPGFKVKAKKSVEVRGTMDDAYIEAGGDVVINGGIFHKTKGSIITDGNATIHFATNANVTAKGDLWVVQEAVNCQLKAEGQIIGAKGKGSIVGGKVVASKGLIIQELGGELGYTTQVIIDVPEYVLTRIQKIDKELKDIQEAKGKLRKVLSRHAAQKKKMQRMPLAQQRALVEHVQKARKLNTREEEIKRERETLFAKRRDSQKSRIIVYGNLYPGVTITMFGRTIEFNQPLRYTSFRYDWEHNKILRTVV
ncbi:MAG: DUF342 domain-containing protein [Planctomycetota bacterium]|nr:MAG: DUF342 domain-containing protein [Planctomycetota bacterium]